MLCSSCRRSQSISFSKINWKLLFDSLKMEKWKTGLNVNDRKLLISFIEKANKENRKLYFSSVVFFICSTSFAICSSTSAISFRIHYQREIHFWKSIGCHVNRQFGVFESLSSTRRSCWWWCKKNEWLAGYHNNKPVQSLPCILISPKWKLMENDNFVFVCIHCTIFFFSFPHKMKLLVNGWKKN